MSLHKAIDALKNQLPQDSWTEDQDIIAPHLIEWRDRWHGVTPFLVKPKNTDEVLSIVNICRENKTPLCIQGGNTGLVGGQTPQGEILLTTKRLKAVRNQTTETITVESGLTLSQIHQFADEQNKKFPLTLASEGSATIGGLCSTNAGGMHVVRYGSMRELVTGLEVVLADGSVINSLERPKKDNTGYDLKNQFIGAEGTLGIITAASLKLVPQATETNTLFLALQSPRHALQLYTLLKNRYPNELTVIELMPALAIDWVTQCFNLKPPYNKTYPWSVLVELESCTLSLKSSIEKFIEKTIKDNLVLDAIIAESVSQAKQLRALRENISAAQKHIGSSIKHDISVPTDKVDEFIQKAARAVIKLSPNCRPLAFGHVGDGNIHFNVMQAESIGADEYLLNWEAMNKIVHDIVFDLGGSISAEHGIGILKKKELNERYPEKVLQLRRLKHAYDPDNLFNPRVLFSEA